MERVHFIGIGGAGMAPLAAILLDAAMVLFVAVRHRANFKRLRSGTESKFHFSSQKRQQVS